MDSVHLDLSDGSAGSVVVPIEHGSALRRAALVAGADAGSVSVAVPPPAFAVPSSGGATGAASAVPGSAPVEGSVFLPVGPGLPTGSVAGPAEPVADLSLPAPALPGQVLKPSFSAMTEPFFANPPPHPAAAAMGDPMPAHDPSRGASLSAAPSAAKVPVASGLGHEGPVAEPRAPGGMDGAVIGARAFMPGPALAAPASDIPPPLVISGSWQHPAKVEGASPLPDPAGEWLAQTNPAAGSGDQESLEHGMNRPSRDRLALPLPPAVPSGSPAPTGAPAGLVMPAGMPQAVQPVSWAGVSPPVSEALPKAAGTSGPPPAANPLPPAANAPTAAIPLPMALPAPAAAPPPRAQGGLAHAIPAIPAEGGPVRPDPAPAMPPVAPVAPVVRAASSPSNPAEILPHQPMINLAAVGAVAVAPPPEGLPHPEPRPQLQADSAPRPLVATLPQLARADADQPVTLKLSPAELGTLRFEVVQREHGLHLHLSVDQPAALDLLRRQGDQLLAELRQSGFPGATLSFAGGSAGGGGQDAPTSQGGSGPHPDAGAPADPARQNVPAAAIPPSALHSSLDLRL